MLSGIFLILLPSKAAIVKLSNFPKLSGISSILLLEITLPLELSLKLFGNDCKIIENIVKDINTEINDLKYKIL